MPTDPTEIFESCQSPWTVVIREQTTRTAGLVKSHSVPVMVSTQPPAQQLWHIGERLHHLYEAHCDRMGFVASRRRVAVEYPDTQFSFSALDRHANRIAHFLIAQGARADDRIAVLLDRSVDSHATVLAISKIGATTVPLDASFPVDRIGYILADSRVSLVVTLTQLAELIPAGTSEIKLDAVANEISAMPARRLRNAQKTSAEDRVCYIIYTSGSTGRPKGVPIRDSSICSFLRAACECYGVEASDRFYQGMTIAFDYSFEELWVPLLSGATLVPAPSGVNLVGDELADFLSANKISGLCCVPTVLASIERDLPDLRFLMVSGEACPQDLADRWCRSDRRFVNTYGPTETTVTATWSAMQPGTKVSIGGPLPGYSIVILAPDKSEALPVGETGEICIGGFGLADGYLNLPKQSAQVFVKDWIGLPDNAPGKLYRTGDLGRIDPDNGIEYLGRIDSQIKIRGYRIELDEIGAIARAVPGVGQAVVNLWEAQPEESGLPPTKELVTYFTRAHPDIAVDPSQIHDAMRTNLPPYMVPAFFEEIDVLPLLPSTKVDRKKLPAPSAGRLNRTGTVYKAPGDDIEQTLAGHLEHLLKTEAISTDAHFFDELGANSLTMAQFLAALGKQPQTRGLSMKVIYQNPTIAALATQLRVSEQIATKQSSATANGSVVPDLTLLVTPSTDQPTALTEKEKEKRPHRASRAAYLICGALQILYLATAIAVTTFGFVYGAVWVGTAESIGVVYARAVTSGAVMFLGAVVSLIAVKWLAIGRVTTDKIPLWSLHYVRFWIARSAIHSNPLNMFVGTPLYNLYLRLLGARIGKHSVIFSRSSTCVDLFSVGDDTIIRPDCFLTGYQARDGFLFPGRVNVGNRSFVGEASVLEINSRVGNDAQLGTSSALLEGCQVPDSTIYQGSPAVPSNTNFNRVEPVRPDRRPRGIAYVGAQLVVLTAGMLPLPFLIKPLFDAIDFGKIDALISSLGLNGPVGSLLTWSAILYGASILSGLLIVTTIPRVLRLSMRSGQVHRLYGVQFYIAQMMTRFSNSRPLNTIFGDSSMIVHYLSAVGYDLTESTQTGSNFGVNQRHHSPFLCKFNRETLVSDGLVMMNMETSSSSFRMSQVTVAGENYLGNLLHFPADSRVGENCLIATKAMIPIDGEVRTDVGILGSPPFEIPRSVVRDQRFDHFKQPDILKRRLRMKLQSNLVTLALYLVRNWTGIAVLMGIGTLFLEMFRNQVAGSSLITAAVMSAVAVISVFLAPVYSVMFERVVLALYPLKPLYCSLYDNKFWLHERFWKLNYNVMLVLFNGTPVKNWFLRLQGAKLGRMVFDDGASITEPSLVEIGDYSCLNSYSSIQCHSLEDGTFKSDRISIGSNCTLGVRGFIHYGAQVGNNAYIQADAFVMKGSTIELGQTWLGNPARDANSKDLNTKPQPTVNASANNSQPIETTTELATHAT